MENVSWEHKKVKCWTHLQSNLFSERGVGVGKGAGHANAHSNSCRERLCQSVTAAAVWLDFTTTTLPARQESHPSDLFCATQKSLLLPMQVLLISPRERSEGEALVASSASQERQEEIRKRNRTGQHRKQMDLTQMKTAWTERLNLSHALSHAFEYVPFVLDSIWTLSHG